MSHYHVTRIAFAVSCWALLIGSPVFAADVQSIVFPVLGSARFGNDYGAPRTGHTHQGNDIFGRKHQQLIAAVTGRISFVAWPQPSYGYAVFIEAANGYRYWYLHINNDTPGTDDGRGGGMSAYAPDIERGNQVTAGQVIGWMGDSGNAEGTSAHLHFEIHRPDGNVINPYESLLGADHLAGAVTPPALPGELLPFGNFFQGGSRIAIGEIRTKSSGEELVVGAGPGGGPQVRVYTAGDTLVSQFFAYEESFRGGIDVATGDVTGDGRAEIITAPGPGREPEVRVFTQYGELLESFLAYAPAFTNGVNVSAADLTDDGLAEIVTGPGVGGGPHVRVFGPDGMPRWSFMAFDPGFRGGVDVAAAARTLRSKPTIVASAGPGGGPHVRVFGRQGGLRSQFFPYASDFRGGVRVDVANVLESSHIPEIVTTPASRGGADVRVFNLNGSLRVYGELAFEPWWSGGYDIAAGDGSASIASGEGGRRATVRNALK